MQILPFRMLEKKRTKLAIICIIISQNVSLFLFLGNALPFSSFLRDGKNSIEMLFFKSLKRLNQKRKQINPPDEGEIKGNKFDFHVVGERASEREKTTVFKDQRPRKSSPSWQSKLFIEGKQRQSNRYIQINFIFSNLNSISPEHAEIFFLNFNISVITTFLLSLSLIHSIIHPSIYLCDVYECTPGSILRKIFPCYNKNLKNTTDFLDILIKIQFFSIQFMSCYFVMAAAAAVAVQQQQLLPICAEEIFGFWIGL